jgi:hypothetical protein
MCYTVDSETLIEGGRGMPINLVKKQYQGNYHFATQEITKENWSMVLLRIKNKDRLDFYEANFENIPDEVKFDFFVDCYTSSEHASFFLRQQGVREALSYYNYSANYVPLAEQLEKHTDPDGFVRIYRGTQSAWLYSKPRGFSWTLSRKTAEWFARRFNLPNPLLYTAQVHINNVLAYLKDREEEEIIALPRHVTVIRSERLEVIDVAQ